VLLLNTLTSLNKGRESRREAKPLLYIYSPFPLSRGRGIKGDGVAKSNLRGVGLTSNLNSPRKGLPGANLQTSPHML